MRGKRPALHRAESVHVFDDLRNEASLALKALGHVEPGEIGLPTEKAFLVVRTVSVLREFKVEFVRRIRHGFNADFLRVLDCRLPLLRRRKRLPFSAVARRRTIRARAFRQPLRDFIDARVVNRVCSCGSRRANRAFGRKRLEAGDGRKVRRKLRHAHVPTHDRRRRRTPRKRLLVALEHVAFERVAHGRVEGGRELWVLRLERRAFDVRRLAGGLAPRAGEEIPPVTLRPWRKRDAVAAAREHVVAHHVVASAVHLHAAEVRP